MKRKADRPTKLKHGIYAAFCLDGFPHILTNTMTVSGGRFRTGEPIEYAISAVVIMISLMLNMMIGDSFAPYFYDWSGLYAEGMIIVDNTDYYEISN